MLAYNPYKAECTSKNRVLPSGKNVHDPGSGSVTQGHREKRVQKCCVSFEEECYYMPCVMAIFGNMIQAKTRVGVAHTESWILSLYCDGPYTIIMYGIKNNDLL